MSDGIPITLGDLVFNEGPDVDGIDWHAHDLIGWDSPVLDAPSFPIIGAHGSTPSGDPRYRARPLVLVGAAGCPSRDAMFLARERLAAEVLSLDNVDGDLVVDEPTPKLCRVRAASSDRPVAITPEGWSFTFDVNLTAHDPRKYAAVETVTPITIAAAGIQKTEPIPNTAGKPGIDTPPLVEITAAGSIIPQPIRLYRDATNSGLVVRVDRDLAVGETLTVDFRTKSLTVNGVNVDQYLHQTSRWFTIPAGGASMIFHLGSGAGATARTANVRTRAAWRA